MIVLPFTPITDAILVSNVAEDPSAVWAPGTFAVGAQVHRPTLHLVFECRVARTGADTTPPESDPDNWLKVGTTNKMAMFDYYSNKATESASPIVVTITPGKRCNGVALFVRCDTAQIVMTVGATQVYSKTFNMRLRRTTGWYSYYHGVFGFRPGILLVDMPPLAGAVITITLTCATANPRCTYCVVGASTFIGGTKPQPVDDALNFSKIERAFDGTLITLVPRPAVPTTQQELILPKGRYNLVRDVRTSLDAVPAVWSSLDDVTEDGYFDAFLLMGIYRQFKFVLITNKDYVNVTLTVEAI